MSREARRWSPRSTWGDLAFALLGIAVLSGLPLVVPFDIRRAYDSLAWMLLTNPAGAFFRNLHYWSGQLFLVLTLVHTWVHLRRSTELRLRPGTWARVALSLPLSVFVMLTGFLLRGDAESQQAVRILAASLESMPLLGRSLALFLLGTEGNRQLIYVHHVGTASLLVWLFVAEHARAVWPRRVALIESFLACVGLGLFFSPTLHDGLDPLVKGPWYLLGLQELLHWASRPVFVVAAGVVLMAWVLFLPRLSDRWARASKWLLASALVLYAALTVMGVFFRGEAWAWGFAGARAAHGLTAHGLGAWRGVPVDALKAHRVPVVLGRREGCLFCHRGVTGLSASHATDAVGCASCHGGNPFSLDKATAHGRMTLVPGNLDTADRTCGTAACHAGIVPRVRTSLMNTLAGIIAVDRQVWTGKPASPGERHALPQVAELGHTGADSHLRQLCASCHVGAAKAGLGPVGELSRGGGCNACHLTYTAAQLRDLERYRATRATGQDVAPATHPNISIAIESRHCFGCHSRSGRISTSYEGWMETDLKAAPSTGHYRTLEDGRVFVAVVPPTAKPAPGSAGRASPLPAGADVHARRGMACVDCHTAREVMGEGMARGRKTEALRVACTHCHVRGAPPLVPGEGLDAESRKIATLRGRSSPGERFLVAGDGPLLNTAVDADGKPHLVAKSSGLRLELRAPAAVCVEGGGHVRLSCQSCHAAWAPRCTRCHTKFDPGAEGVDLLDGTATRGAWVETAGGFSAQAPTLGVAEGGSRAAESRIDTFIPGMVITLDRNQAPGGRPDHVFRRLYARAFSHTISKEARTCQSCHADPVALGYGEGKLMYGLSTENEERSTERGVWRFVPAQPPGPDGLPADAWVGFLQERAAGASTRQDVRPFTIEEQRRILTVGACLTCHDPVSTALRTSVTDWKGTLARVSPRCVLPRWP
jgi:hypothetical protein